MAYNLDNLQRDIEAATPTELAASHGRVLLQLIVALAVEVRSLRRAVQRVAVAPDIDPDWEKDFWRLEG